jgi:hypothetical protein
MDNPFNISDERLKELLSSYETWMKSIPKEALYPETIREQTKKLRDDFLSKERLSQLSDDELYKKIYDYSRKLEGKAYRTLPADVIRRSLGELRHHLEYLISSGDTPTMVAQNLIDGKYKIKNFSKAFWSPILQARFPEDLPNWNNKTENFLGKLGLHILTYNFSTEEKYKQISAAFKYLINLVPGHDFYTINHLMHYGTAIKEGIDLIARMQGRNPSDPVAEMINTYKESLQREGLKDELYKWKLIKTYRGRPDISARDFNEEISGVDFKNLVFYNAVRVRKHIASDLPEDYRSCFIKLFDESVDIDTRIKGFISDVLAVYRKAGGTMGSHHDERTAAAFLTFYNPLKYTFFKDSFYRKYCILLGVAPKTKGDKFTHYLLLVSDLIKKYISQDKELIDLVNKNLDNDCFDDPNHLILAQDILFQMLGKNDDEEENQNDLEEEDNNYIVAKTDVSEPALNIILYGPPGTGKTYNTIDLAVKIAAPAEYKEGNHALNKTIYERLVKSGQIAFTTFHQSMNYEDFIEGIKPSSNETSNLTYSIEDGLFKQLAINAAFEFVGERSPDASKSLNFSTVYDQLIDEVNEKIGNNVGFTLKLRSGAELEVVEITGASNFLVQHKNGSRTYTVSRKRLEKLFSELPDLDDIYNINEEIRNVIGGSNASAYWAVLKKLRSYRGEIQPSGTGKKYSYDDKAAAVEKLLPEDVIVTGNEKRFVLIIDEINRGNVSQVFGELITLIEEDKRFGKKERLSAKLPYSRSRFFVPPNLYIVGTMNTADRSVEALDTALRRRFSFIEMVPLYDLEGMEKEIAGVRISVLLEIINGRIEKLIDRDHRIGHSYFLGLDSTDDLMKVFKYKIIPLLQEYFYGNYEKMGLVMGNGFIERISEDKVKFAQFKGYENDYDDKVIYKINTHAIENYEDFIKAIAELFTT